MAQELWSVRSEIHRDVEKHNLVTTTVTSRIGTEKVVRYDLKALVRYSGFCTLLSQGSVLTMDRTALINVGIMLVFGMCTCILFVVICLIFHDLSYLTKLDFKAWDRLAEQIQSLVPFVLGLYMSLSLERWWALRKLALGNVFDAFTNSCMILGCELHDKKWTQVRAQVAKYGFASIELLVQAARNLDELEKVKGLLEQSEIQFLEKTKDHWQRPMIVWSWIMRVCICAMDHHKTPVSRSSKVMAQCQKAREGMTAINTYLDSQLPFAYVHLITLLVNVQNITHAFSCGMKFAAAIPTQNMFQMVTQIFSLIVVVFIYNGLLQISYMILDPFGDDVLDFPMKAYQTFVALNVDAMYEAQKSCPVVAENGALKRPKGRPAMRGQASHQTPPVAPPAARQAAQGGLDQHPAQDLEADGV